MARQPLLAAVLLVALVRVSGLAQAPPQSPSLEELLGRVARYLATYERTFSGVVSEEHYVQARVPAVGLGRSTQSRNDRRELTSDVVAVTDTGHTWLSFRDMFAVDGTPVRDRDERLQTLLLTPRPDLMKKAREIADEGARFNIGTVVRNINFPTMALAFLAASNQARSHFKIKGTEVVGTTRAIVISFNEFASPTIVRSAGADLPLVGRFWIEPETGAVLKIEANDDAKRFSGQTEVTFGYIDKLQMWMPVEMKDTSSTSYETVRGHATYSNFRRFGVSTGVVIK